MLIKHALYTVVTVVLLTIGGGLAIAFFRHDLSTASVLEKIWLCSGGTAFIGYLFGKGASSGGDVLIDQATTSVSHDPEKFRHADSADARLGISFGFLVMITGVLLFAACLAVIVLTSS